ncbi:hypothetical protein MJH12_01765, partial [bacterium]|nr:hypothetical protein [bacterium]
FFVGKLKIVNAFLGGKSCTFNIFYYSDNTKFHRLKFTEDAGIELFVSGSSTASRHWYFPPIKKQFLTLEISEDQKQVSFQLASGQTVIVDSDKGQILSIDGVQIVPSDYSKDPRNSNTPIKAVESGVYIDSLVRWGVDARRPVTKAGKNKYRHRSSLIIDKNNKKCRVPNFYLYDYDFDYEGLADGIKFLFPTPDAKVTTNLEMYNEQVPSVPAKRRAAFKAKLSIIDQSKMPKNENFKEFVTRYCPSLSF